MKLVRKGCYFGVNEGKGEGKVISLLVYVRITQCTLRTLKERQLFPLPLPSFTPR